jgi:tetratricopeptide (TPR) repeat protein
MPSYRPRSEHLEWLLRQAESNDHYRARPAVVYESASVALKESEKAQDVHSIARSKVILGKLALENCAYPKARRLFREAHQIFQAVGDGVRSQFTLEHIGIEHMLAGRFEQGAHALKSAIATIAEDDSAELSKLSHDLANVYLHKGDLSESLQHNFQSVRQHEGSEARGLGFVLYDIAFVLHRCRRESQANPFLDLAEREVQRDIRRDEVAVGIDASPFDLKLRADINLLQGNATAALQLYRASHDLLKRFGFHVTEAECLLDMGRTLVRLGRPEAAGPHFSQALKLAAQIGNNGLNARTQLAYGQYCTATEDYTTAQASLARAFAYAKRMENRDLQVIACESLARLQEAKGNFATATRYWHDAADILQSFAIPSNILDERLGGHSRQLEKYEDPDTLASRAQAEELRELRGIAKTQEALLRSIRGQLNEFRTNLQVGKEDRILTLVQLIDNHLRDGSVDSAARKELEHIDSEFIQALRLQYPTLTAGELQVCSFLALGLENAQIVKLFSLSLRTVQNHRFRIRRKMKLSRNQDLRAELRRLRF